MSKLAGITLCLFYIFNSASLYAFHTDGHEETDATAGHDAFVKDLETDSILLTGEVFDRLTSHPIIGTTIEVLSTDSIPFSKTKGGKRFKTSRFSGDAMKVQNDSTSLYEINIPKINGDYLIRISGHGYETEIFKYTLEAGRREFQKKIPNVYLNRYRETTLQEFTVSTSKVMFYNKGDTIVYNADAFALPEGSMLDALVKQMPGVEIKNNKIYVNGKFVESLLLNGKDFFKGNKKAFMDNIGAYTVKDIAVYEKRDELTSILGDRGDVDTEYVMDVRLKKDYMTGYMVNTEIGGGTYSRYTARIFAMQHTNNSRFAVYGNANNINKSNNLSENDEGFSVDKKNGINRRVNGGVDYLVDNSFHTWEIAGNVDVGYDNKRNNKITNEINYLQEADNYGYSNEVSRTHNLSVSTYHTLKLKKESWNLNVRPQFTYNKNRDDNEEVRATFDDSQTDISGSQIRDIYSGQYEAMRRSLINRTIRNFEDDRHGYTAKLNTDYRMNIPGSPDGIALKFESAYSRSTEMENSLRDICFGYAPASSRIQHQFTTVLPLYDFKIGALGRYFFNIPVGSLNASYEFTHTQTRKNSSITMLDAIAENGMAVLDPTMIPVPDYANSYTSKIYRNEHRVKLKWFYQQKFRTGRLTLTIEPLLVISNRHMFYHRGDLSTTPQKTDFLVNIPNANIRWATHNKKWEYKFRFSMKQTPVNLLNIADFRDTTNPMNILEGNPYLKNKSSYSIAGSVLHNASSVFRQTLNISSGWIVNDFVSGFQYDSHTGVKTTSTYNVSGNNYFGLSHNLTYRFGGKNPKLLLYNDIGLFNNKYSNMIGYDASPSRQSVMLRRIFESFSLRYSLTKKINLSIQGAIDIENSHSEGNAVFTRNNNGLWNIRLAGWYESPFHISISSDIGYYRRFGYIDEALNSHDILWNAELAYSINKGQWRLSLKANDILNQDKGLSLIVNADGRQQISNTVLPRYVMLCIQYKFNYKP